HVFWAVLLGYYIYRAKKWFAIIISPILILSSFGTVFFAQHYFVDVPAGILTAFAAIFLTTIYFNRLR
ncbi:MAG: phosphatase PAP2 family protein, partial [Patescibacteria group bacterium]